MKISTDTSYANVLRKPRRRGFGVGSFLLLTVIGCAFLGIGLIFVKDELLSLGWPTTSGTIEGVAVQNDIDGALYRPTVRYKVGATTYYVTSHSRSSVARSVGEKMTVAYEPSNPSHAALRSSGTDFLVYLFPVIGILLVTFSSVLFVRSRIRGNEIRALQHRGIKLQGVVTDVQSRNQQDTVRIIVSATSPDGRVRDYLSDEITGNTFTLIGFRKQPIPMDVYIDPTNPDNYYVDISNIPSLTPNKIALLLQQATTARTISPLVDGEANTTGQIDESTKK